MNEYRVSFNENYILESVERVRRQRHVYPWFIAVKIVCALGLAVLIAIVIFGALKSIGSSAPLAAIALVLSIFLVLLLQGPKIDYFFLKRKLRRSPFYGDDVSIVVSDDGVSVGTQRSQTTLQWSAFTRARRQASGYLLFTDPTVSHWWPDAALTNGTAAEVGRLLRKNIRAYEGNDA